MSISINTLNPAIMQAVNYEAFHKVVNAASAAHPHRIIRCDHRTLIINHQRRLIAQVVLPHFDHTGFCVPLQYHVIRPTAQPSISRFQLICMRCNENLDYSKTLLRHSLQKLFSAGHRLAAGASPKPTTPNWTTLRLTS